MKRIYVSTRGQWRKWLSENHDRERGGIWLVFYKRKANKPSLDYDESVEEALCFGWIDSIIRRLDDERYCRKFTPRKNESSWSNANKRRVNKILKAGRMTEFGLAKVRAAKEIGTWELPARPALSMAVPPELSAALARNKTASDSFERLAPTYRKRFIGWIAAAKRPGTRINRLKASLLLLKSGKKLGLK